MAIQNRISEHFEAVSEQAQETIDTYPLAVAVVVGVFGLGLIVGVVGVSVLQSERPSQNLAQRIGNRFMELISQITAQSRDR